MLIRILFITISLFSDVYASSLKVYTIGNSLTGDTIPGKYASGWHICGGHNLKKIHNNPDCSKNNKLTWKEALTEKKYNIITVQPYYGTRLSEDIEVISDWVKLQSSAIFVIHSGWPAVNKVHSSYIKGNIFRMNHSPFYFSKLVNKLKFKFPEIEFRINPAFIALELIHNDIQNKQSPFKSLVELYRDNLHMNNVGKYLMHNLTLHTLQLPKAPKMFSKIPKHTKNYLDSIIIRASIESDKIFIKP